MSSIGRRKWSGIDTRKIVDTCQYGRLTQPICCGRILLVGGTDAHSERQEDQVAYEIELDNDYHLNSERFPANGRNKAPCAVCGRAVRTDKPFWTVHLHHGGWTAVTEEEAETLNATGHAHSEMGFHPVGPECAKKYPELKPYLHRERGWV
jgi:hypothetical protein